LKLLRAVALLLMITQIQALYAKTDLQAKLRAGGIDSIVIHAIGGPYCRDGQVRYSYARGGLQYWLRFFAKQPVVGIHYLIARDGSIASSITEAKVANHALGRNLRSIGIELINAGDGVEPYPSLQFDSLVALVTNIRARNPGIDLKNVLRHSDIDKRYFVCNGVKVKRKQDPGVLFDYSAFLKALL
jgi:N-acetylmuramoyl-L-alanine amidase